MTAHPVIDLHMHTAVSDGTDTPAELLGVMRAAGVDCFSVTDHDAIAGCEQVKALRVPGDPQFLFGVEFSCMDEMGKYHVLGYGYDPASGAICSVIEEGHENRIKKLGLRLRMLRDDFGIAFPDADVDALYALSNPGKPHIANLMVRYGHADSIRKAFETVLNRLAVPEYYIRPEEAIRGIVGAGGVPVLAHPCYGDGDQLIVGDALTERVRRLTDFGLAGLEGYYSGFTETLQQQVLALADRFDLYVTAGSDYHGRNKLIRPAETGLDPKAPLPKRLERFLKDLFSE